MVSFLDARRGRTLLRGRAPLRIVRSTQAACAAGSSLPVADLTQPSSSYTLMWIFFVSGALTLNL